MPTPVQQPSTGAGRPFALPTTSGFVTGTGEGEYLGFTAAETGGTSPVNITLHDSTDASGPIIEVIRLAAGQSSGDHYPRPAREVTVGIFASISGSGTLSGSVFQ